LPQNIGLTDTVVKGIIPKYNAAANESAADVPKNFLDERHLRVIIIKLLQSGVVSEPTPRQYIVSNSASAFAAGMAAATESVNYNNKMTASQTPLAYQVLYGAKDPLSTTQLLQRMIALGGEKGYLSENLPLILNDMWTRGLVKYLGDGRVALVSTAEIGVAKIQSTQAVGDLLPKIDNEMFRYILWMNSARTVMCYSQGETPEELKSGSFYKRMQQAGIISIRQLKGDNKDCSVRVEVEPNEKFWDLQNFYFTAMSILARQMIYIPEVR
jgi:hypothetical protein